MASPENRFRLVFIGPQQAGKTTLMCGWYYLAKEVYQAEPVEDYGDTKALLDTYNRYLNGQAVNPTSRGEVTKALLRCRKENFQFELELIDYSGEDILSSAHGVLYSDDDEDQEAMTLGRDLIADLRSAEWIILVQDPLRVAQGTVNDAHNSLWLARALPKVIYEGNVGPVENVSL